MPSLPTQLTNSKLGLLVDEGLGAQSAMMVTSALSECSSGLARRGPPADAERKRIRVAPSTARQCISKLRSPQRSSHAPRRIEKQSTHISVLKSENLVRHPQRRIENLVQPCESENLRTSISIVTPPRGDPRASSSDAMSPSPFASQKRTGQIRDHSVEAEVDMQAVARVKLVKSAAE